MARKKKNRRHHKKSTRTLSLEQRATHAKDALDHGHYQKAIVHLKQLLKADPENELWPQWIYTAHIQLGLQLSRHNKHHEVIVLYENGNRLCHLSLFDPVYLRALLCKKRYKNLMVLYAQIESHLDKTPLFKLRTELAAVALSGEKGFIDKLPANDPVVIDYEKGCQ